MEHEKQLTCVEQIKRLEALLPDYDIYLHFGTLLGSVREQGLIGHDDDIDVAYMSHYHTPQEVEDETIMLYRKFLELGILGPYFKQERNEKWFVPVEVPDENIQEPVGQCHIKFGDNHLDLYTTWVDDNGDYYNPLEASAWCKGADLFPFRVGKLYDQEFKIPNNSEFLLEHHYGDWQTPRDEKAHKPIYSALKLWKERYEK